MTPGFSQIDDLIGGVSELIDQGAMAVPCDSEMNALSHPVVVDNLLIGNLRGGTPGRVNIVLGWRAIGVTEEFESGAFNVEEPEFLRINSFSLQPDRILFYHDLLEDNRSILAMLPLDEEHRAEWEEWNSFKMKNRDVFEDLDIQMLNILNYFQSRPARKSGPE